MLYFFLAIIVIVFLIGLVVIINTIRFKPNDDYKVFKEEVLFDKDKNIKTLQQMIKCKTVSNIDNDVSVEKEFIKFEEVLFQNFPNVFNKCKYIKVSDKSMLLYLKGKTECKNIVLMAHYDVVPADNSTWSADPFSGYNDGTSIWGRGCIDTKGTLNGILNALENLLIDGYIPNNNLYLAFGGNEEINGDGALKIVEYFKKNNIKIDMVLDEGGAVVEGVFPKVKEKCAVVGIAEKGMLNIRLEAVENGGHASSPKRNGAIIRLAKSITKLEKKSFKYRLNYPAKEMFNTLGKYSSFFYRIIFSNLCLFNGVLNLICKKSGGEMNALVRTTCAFTQMEGSKAKNVLPDKASIICNLRIICGENTDSVFEYVKKVVRKYNINVIRLDGMDPSDISKTNSEEWNALKNTILETWDNTIVTPYLMIACSDSKHYSGFCENVYRFSPMTLSNEERAMIHGIDERIPIDTLNKVTEFYIRLIKKIC